jgi:hypothetical protein
VYQLHGGTNAIKKTFVIAFLITVLIVSGLALVGVLHFGTVKAATPVAGIISSETWTAAGSPYVFTAPVGIPEGVTLTIEPGVTVTLGTYDLLVNGTLRAIGTTAAPINFDGSTTVQNSRGVEGGIEFTDLSTGWSEPTDSGCIIENAIFENTIISIESSPAINNCVINCPSYSGTAILVPSSEIQISSGSPTISNNRIIGYGEDSYLRGITCDADSPVISGNLISGWSANDIYVSAGSPVIQENVIINSGGSVTDINQGGGIALAWDCTPIIRDNTITNNAASGIIIRPTPEFPTPIILSNNIYGNPYNVYVCDAANINATYNWWGTTDTQAISQTIHDSTDDFTLGTVEFVPFLTELNPEAPAIPTFTITASAGAGGSISPSGSVSVVCGDDQTFTVTPNSGYQIASVLMDGVSATAPYTFVNVVADGHTISATFEEIPTSTPSPSPSPTPTPAPTPASTQISISVDAPSTDVGSAVNVNGHLSDSNGTPLQDKSVTLSYALADSDSWVPVGSGITDSAGEYGIQWVNTASGTFTLKAGWNGNGEYLGASATTTLSFLPYQNQQVFFVESDSAVSALAFNSTSSELSFTVSGPDGTAGYVKVTIAKSLVANAADIKVYLDGNQLNYDVTSNTDSWLLSFTYTHSTHNVMVSLATNEAGGTFLGNALILIAVVIAIAVAGAIGLIVWRKKKKT